MIVTEQNLDEARDYCVASDQRDKLIPGCETWAIYYEPGTQRGQMTIWPDGTGAVSCGGDSAWGVWDSDFEWLELDTSEVVDINGEMIEEPFYE